MENFISRNETTKAFNDYAHKIFQRQIELRIDDKAFDFDHGVVSELNLRKAIAGHLSGWLLINMPDWKDVKSKYLQDCKNKSLNQDEFSELKNEFETLAKQFKYDKTVTCPVWEPYDNGKYVQDWDYRHIQDNNITNTAEALELAESYFNDWLDIDLREHEMGKSLSC